jgi:transposase
MGAVEQLRLDVILKIESGKMRRSQACAILDVSERTLERYIASYRKLGPVFLKHGNFGKVPANKSKDEVKSTVQRLVREKYHDFNMSHCLEKLEKEEEVKIKRETFRKWCHEIRHVKRRKRRSAKARHYRDRMQSTGLLLQMDGSPHVWFGNQESTLITAIDDADSNIPYGEFFPAEDTISCMTVLQNIVEKMGMFELLYVDRAGIFGGHKRAQFSQVKRALRELGIHIIFAQSAEAKGRIERTFQTLQDRIVPEMRLREIKTYPAANNFLKEYFPTEWKERFTVEPKNPTSAYRQLTGDVDLKEIFCLKHYRTAKRDHTISFDGKIYSFTCPSRFSIHKQQIELRTYQDLTQKAFYRGQEIKLTLIDEVERYKPRWQYQQTRGSR